MGPQPEGTATTAGISAGEIMTTPVITVSPDTPAGEIAETLTRHRVSAVPVVDATGAVLGLVSEYDLLAKVGSRARCHGHVGDQCQHGHLDR